MKESNHEQVIFLHIPKAGGSTLRTLLRRQYRDREIYEIREDINGDIVRFCAKSESERAATGLLMGHMSFGLHQFLPGNVIYLTMLRSPERRVLSEFRFLKSNPYHLLHDMVKNLSLMEYLESEMTGQISNGQTRLLCGVAKNGHTGIPTRRRMEEHDLEQALHNLNDHFPVVGLIEQYDESLLLWRRLLGWRYPRYVKENITSTDGLDDPNAEELAYLRQINQLDSRLYDAAKRNLTAEIDRQPPSFYRELAIFRLLNRVYGKVVATRRRLSLLRGN